MLGSLPSSYLKWVSKNLRAGDSEYWAKLADEVLEDDVYKDKIEWEFAEEVLHGSDVTIKNREKAVNSISMLLEVSERYGWDNEDKIGWSKINFEFLGTSKGGRIPRLSKSNEQEKERRREIKKKKKKEEEEEDGNGWRRRERRERMRLSLVGRDGKMVNRVEKKGVLERLEDIEKQIEPKVYSPFPGRESLLKKVMNKKKIQ
ncbi:hypothetical protein AALP_AA4G049000 [Arabis alpina]|uniref:Uncharacterized protein n=1 Tax=Arabis alpina TaxID=50452 RepID=A0A087H180_ARAAL|nr:hypothetical protein AALP_AA4G049000 [Arabis alpina]